MMPPESAFDWFGRLTYVWLGGDTREAKRESETGSDTREAKRKGESLREVIGGRRPS